MAISVKTEIICVNLTFPFKNSYPGISNCKPTSLFALGYSCTPIYPGKYCAYLGKLLNKQDNRFLTWIKHILIRTVISSSRLALRPLPCCVDWYKTTMSQTSSSPNKQCLERSVLNHLSPSPQASWKPFNFFPLCLCVIIIIYFSFTNIINLTPIVTIFV